MTECRWRLQVDGVVESLWGCWLGERGAGARDALEVGTSAGWCLVTGGGAPAAAPAAAPAPAAGDVTHRCCCHIVGLRTGHVALSMLMTMPVMRM